MRAVEVRRDEGQDKDCGNSEQDVRHSGPTIIAGQRPAHSAEQASGWPPGFAAKSAARPTVGATVAPGVVTNTRPITLLNAYRKLLSLIALFRLQPDLEKFVV